MNLNLKAQTSVHTHTKGGHTVRLDKGCIHWAEMKKKIFLQL